MGSLLGLVIFAGSVHLGALRISLFRHASSRPQQASSHVLSGGMSIHLVGSDLCALCTLRREHRLLQTGG